MAVTFSCHPDTRWAGVPLVLASQSPRRLELCRKIGLEPDICHPANIDETEYKHEKPVAYARRMAISKAEAIRPEFPEHIILSGDTVVACGHRILPKAEDEATARSCLELLSGRRHRVYGGLCLITPDGQVKYRLSVSQVSFKKLSGTEMSAYLGGGEWDGKAGGYAIQGQAEQFISAISGSYANIMGFDVHVISGMLGAIGFCHQP